MTASQKAELMEALWQDMTSHSDSLPSVSWHKQILDERRQAVEEGDARYSSLEETSKELLERYS